MFNQSFTTDNFRKIFDYENRRGVYLEGEFFPEIEKLSQEIKRCTTAIRNVRRKKLGMSYDEYNDQRLLLIQKKQELKRRKEELLTKELDKISAEIAAGNLKATLSTVIVPGKKNAFTIERTPHAYFALKQIQYNVRTLFNVKQNSRYDVICQLKRVLEDRFPKFVVRADIANFYESIPHDKLREKINKDTLLTLPSKRIINQILKEHTRLSGSPNGVPRGIGVSAYLAELYMRGFDEAIRSHEDVTFYVRYVDDIVVVFSPKPNSRVGEYLPFIGAEAANLGLYLHDTKKSEENVTKPRLCTLEYLGYRITYGDGTIYLGLSSAKNQKYKDRITLCFDAYKKNAPYDEPRARKILVKRIRFLTCNTRLHNSKRSVIIGSFYSNSLLSSAKEFDEADNHLSSEIASLSSESLKNRLMAYSFKTGFSSRRYAPFKVQELEEIVRLWKYEAKKKIAKI